MSNVRCELPGIAEAVHVLIPSLHKTVVDVAEPQGMQDGSDQSYGKHGDGGYFIVEALDERIHHEHGKEQRHARYYHLHFRVTSTASELLVKVNRHVVIDGQLEQERKDCSRCEEKAA